MADEIYPRANRWKRFSDWDGRQLRLDQFAVEDATNGFAAFKRAELSSAEAHSDPGQ